MYKDPLITLDGSIKMDPTLTHYYGNSLGGIIGDVYMATSLDVVRGMARAIEPGARGEGQGRGPGARARASG